MDSVDSLILSCALGGQCRLGGKNRNERGTTLTQRNTGIDFQSDALPASVSSLPDWNGRERLHLTNAEPGIWRATFSRHAMTSAEGFGAATTLWGAVQEAAWGALKDDPPA